MRILAIETSCDETAICVLETGGSADAPSFTVLGNALLSQAALHAPYGGVFPNLAKREHQHNLVPILAEALRTAGMLVERTSHVPLNPDVLALLARETELLPEVERFLPTIERPAIDRIAVTTGPGLEPALWVGINFAKVLAAHWQLPLVPVNHMEGHVAASLVDATNTQWTLAPNRVPAIALLVSGGHTELQLIRRIGEYQLLGETRDDAAGECFDKTARLLGLPYPGGPEIGRLAADARAAGIQYPTKLPRPMYETRDYDFSFSGLKTAVRRELEQRPLAVHDQPAFAREIEDAIFDVLVSKTLRAAHEYHAHTVVVGGGVSASPRLREVLAEACAKDKIEVFFPLKGLSTDNAVMIALAAALRSEQALPAPEDIRACGQLALAMRA